MPLAKKLKNSFLKNKTILITGGTGSFGKFFLNKIIKLKLFKKIIIYSRDELKQYQQSKEIGEVKNVRFLIGDVRDRERLIFATKNVDVIVHTAALKQVPASEYNPFECVKTNVIGTQNLIESAIQNKVEKIIALSTDKAALPINLYGASKLASDKLITAANNMVGNQNTVFSVVRYGNVLNSRGSLVPLLHELKNKKFNLFPLTHKEMTRFWITLDHATDFVLESFLRMKGGEIFVPKIPSIKITDLMQCIKPGVKYKLIGIRPGEKIHELMCPSDSAQSTVEFKKYFIILPSTSDIKFYKKVNYNGEKGKFVSKDFEYRSDTNSHFLSAKEIKNLLKKS